MERAVISFIGRDQPGIMHAVARFLDEMGCNIEEVSQSILRGEFAAMAIAGLPDDLGPHALADLAAASFAKRDLAVTVRPFAGDPEPLDPAAEPFVITLHGPDRTGLIASVTGVLAAHGVNIENLKAMSLEDDPGLAVIAFEVVLPAVVDRSALRRALDTAAADLGVSISLQHRDIFEAVHRVDVL